MNKLKDIVIDRINKNIPINEQESYDRIHTQLNHPDPEVRIGTFSDFYDDEFSPEHLDKALSDSDWRVRYRAANHKNASSDNIHKALMDDDVVVKTAALENPNVNEEHISRAIGDVDPIVREDAISHPKATKEHFIRGLMDPNQDIRHKAVDRLYSCNK